mgnify:FL=1
MGRKKKRLTIILSVAMFNVNIPMSTTKGDFDEPDTMLFYSERTPGYDGEPSATREICTNDRTA